MAQGGPPMITDDPGTPGNGKWEINLALAFEHRPGETSYDLPAIDLNYGVGEHVQLTLQTAPVLLKRGGHGPIGGIGRTEEHDHVAVPDVAAGALLWIVFLIESRCHVRRCHQAS